MFPVLPENLQTSDSLDGEALDLVAHGTDLARQLARFVARDARGNDGAADATGTAEVHFAAHIDVGDVLVLAQESATS